MEILTLEEIKWQCKLEYTDTDEDTQLTQLGTEAEVQIANLCQRSLDDLMAEYGDDLSLAPPLRRAMLMCVSTWYDHRDNTSPNAQNHVPGNAFDIVMPYVKLV